MFSQILLPLDRSPLAECVLPHAAAIARSFESRVTLVHVMDSPRHSNGRRGVDPLNWRIRKAEAESYLGDLALRLQKTGLATDSEILEGQAADRIVEYSHKNKIPLVVLSSHGQSGLSGWNVSSVVQKIIFAVHTSILIVRAQQPGQTDVTSLRYDRILLPLDGSQRAECVLPVAGTLARSHEALVLLSHVVRRPEMPRRTPPTDEDVELADRIVERNQAEAIQYLGQIRTQMPGNTQVRVVVSEHGVATLHELVEQEKVGLVVLSAHGYSALTRWPYGSVVSSFISYGTTPLLIVQDLPHGSLEPAWSEAAARKNGE
ncbi:MAG: universal stress protein [Chloroflexi bacterium]|nr:universal stress protein [Chloroflexota bacterium]